MSDLKTTFSDAVCPTPDAQSGDQGIGGGLDMGAGGSGLCNVAWKDTVCPIPGGDSGGGPFGDTARFSNVDGSTHKGASEAATITETPMRTIDRK